jgi:hypothetical protein
MLLQAAVIYLIGRRNRVALFVLLFALLVAVPSWLNTWLYLLQVAAALLLTTDKSPEWFKVRSGVQ